MRALVIGGFEYSGHDSLVEAVSSTGQALNHEVVQWHWRDVIACDDHPIFHLHRVGVSVHEPELAAIMDDPRIIEGLVADLSDLLPLHDADGVISVHPWSTAIAAEAASRLSPKQRPEIIDCHGEFSPFPLDVAKSPFVSCYAGGVFPAAGPPNIRRRTMNTGVPVRVPFQAGPSSCAERSGLTISVGHDSWAASPIGACLEPVVELLRPSMVYVIGESSDAATVDYRVALTVPQYVTKGDEISQALGASSHLLTKGSGSAIAEALAMGCIPLCVESGVFWEDEARAWLSGANAVIPIDVESAGRGSWCSVVPGGMPNLGAECRRAANKIWGMLEQLRESDKTERKCVLPAAIDKMIRRIYDHESLPNTSRALVAALLGWQ
jgi:hypothetical protein